MNMRATAAVLTILCVPALASAQVPPAPSTTTQPAPPPKRPRAAAQSTATVVLTATVNDPSGAPLPDVKVTVIGPVEREGSTTSMGQARMLGIRAGTYRLRFEKDGFYTFEKEVTWRSGPAPTVEATLTPAPPPPPPPPPTRAEPATPVFVPDLPAGKPSNLDVPDYIERNHISTKEPRKESLIGCSGGAQAWLWQVREPWQNRQHESAELMLYVVGGEGTLAMNGRDIPVAAGTLAVIPRGTTYGLTRRGRAPAIYILATLSGPPCAH
jgi:mannose-6-phosphate isomerase-like protein (cupin superfamily)